MSEGVYREHAPPAALAAHVRCIWTYESDGESAPQRIAPDGSPELIVHLGAPYEEESGGVRLVQPRVLFAGQHTRPLILHARGALSCIGVRFEPDGARGFLGRPLSEATDKRLDMGDAKGVATLVRALDASEDPIGLVSSFVAARIGAPPDPDVRAAVKALREEPAIDTALSTRALQRRFAEHVGVSARMLATIFRFRRVFDAIEAGGSWIEAALEAGYFDQPQMARDFRRFLGCTATEWARQRTGLAYALAASETYKKAG
ncbi:MAG: DUF6597 domain-containing transcriptional factor [Hyphomonadaceae bacterium]